MIDLAEVLPWGSFLGGLFGGGVLGRFVSPRAALWALAAIVGLAIYLVVRFSWIGIGQHGAGMGITLAIGFVPVLCGAVLGWFAGRKLATYRK